MPLDSNCFGRDLSLERFLRFDQDRWDEIRVLRSGWTLKR